MTDWRSRWLVTIASDVGRRDGIGWEFATFRQEDVWFVFREDGGPFPVFSAARGDGVLPPPEDLAAMTRDAVSDLLGAAGLPDDVGWITGNITAALLLAASDVVSWEGEEWALEDGDEQTPAWSGDEDSRVPFAWLRARTDGRDAVIDVYQDDAVFGLSFVSVFDRELPEVEVGSLRPRGDVPLVTGPVRAVEVVLDTQVEGGAEPGLLTEVLLHGESSSTLLISAEAYSSDEWHLCDESVVALDGLSAADDLEWVPARRPWTSTI